MYGMAGLAFLLWTIMVDTTYAIRPMPMKIDPNDLLWAMICIAGMSVFAFVIIKVVKWLPWSEWGQ